MERVKLTSHLSVQEYLSQATEVDVSIIVRLIWTWGTNRGVVEMFLILVVTIHIN